MHRTVEVGSNMSCTEAMTTRRRALPPRFVGFQRSLEMRSVFMRMKTQAKYGPAAVGIALGKARRSNRLVLPVGQSEGRFWVC